MKGLGIVSGVLLWSCFGISTSAPGLGVPARLPVEVELVDGSRVQLSWPELPGVTTYTLFHSPTACAPGGVDWVRLAEVEGTTFEADLTGAADFYCVHAEGATSLYDETMAVIELAEQAFLGNLESMDMNAAMQAVAAAMEEHPRVAAISCETGSETLPLLHVELSNGLTFLMPVIYTNLSAEETGMKRAEDSPGNQAWVGRSDTWLETREITDPHQRLDGDAGVNPDINLPENRKALLVELTSEASNIKAYEAVLKKAGYEVDYVDSSKVETFAKLSQYGFVYIGAHGAYSSKTGDYWILTDEWSSKDQFDNYLKQGIFDGNTIGFANCFYFNPDENSFGDLPDTHFIINQRFIGRWNNSFAPHSIVYMDACQSMYGKEEARPPLLVVLKSLGLETYLGWTHVVGAKTARNAHTFIFGHLLGAFPENLGGYTESSPPPRPDTLVDVWYVLLEKGLNLFHGHNKAKNVRWTAELKEWPEDFKSGNNVYEAILRPSIEQLVVDVYPDDLKQELTIDGRLGSEEGRVIVCSSPEGDTAGGTELTLEGGWDPYSITAKLPDGTHGYVVVENGGRKSNAHPLTQWAVDFESRGTFSSGGYGPDFEVEFHSIWRDEIVEERPMPASDPFPQYGWTSTLFGLDSTCEYKYTGIFEDSRYIYEYKEEQNTGTFGTMLEEGQMYFGSVTTKPSAGTVDIQIAFAKEAIALVTDKTKPDSPPEQKNMPVMLGFMLQTSLVSGNAIQGGEQVIPYLIQWEDTEPESPPVETTGQ